MDKSLANGKFYLYLYLMILSGNNKSWENNERMKEHTGSNKYLWKNEPY